MRPLSFLVDMPTVSVSKSYVALFEVSHSQEFQSLTLGLEVRVTEIQNYTRLLVDTPSPRYRIHTLGCLFHMLARRSDNIPSALQWRGKKKRKSIINTSIFPHP